MLDPFDSALAAFHHGDTNPLRQHLELELELPCDDCGRDTRFNASPVGSHCWICADCKQARTQWLEEVLS